MVEVVSKRRDFHEGGLGRHRGHLQRRHQLGRLRRDAEAGRVGLLKDLQRLLTVRRRQQLSGVYSMRRRGLARPGVGADFAVARGGSRRRMLQQPPAILAGAGPPQFSHSLFRYARRSPPLDFSASALAFVPYQLIAELIQEEVVDSGVVVV